MNAETDKTGRIEVNADLTVPGRASAVASVFGLHLAGLPPWLNRGSRLITGDAASDFDFDREIARGTAAPLDR